MVEDLVHQITMREDLLQEYELVGVHYEYIIYYNLLFNFIVVVRMLILSRFYVEQA